MPIPTRSAPFATPPRRWNRCPRTELTKLAAAGRLQSIPGVGKSTAQAITEALAGDVPAYLAKLETEPPPIALDAPAQALLDQLQGDCHSHSDWSDGGSPIREMAEAARDLGHHYLVLTDHSARLTVAHGLDAERLRNQLEVVGALNEEMAPFRILTGIEVDILEDGALDQDEDLLAELDVVVASVHSKLRMDGTGHDQAHAGRHREPAHRHPRALHRPAHHRKGTPAVHLRRRSRLRRLCPHRHRGGDQLPPRATGPARGPAATGHRARVPRLHRHRRPRARAARVAGPGVHQRHPGRGARATGWSTECRPTTSWPGRRPTPPEGRHPILGTISR